MILDQNGNLSVITQENASIKELLKKIQESHSKIKNDNIIVNLTSLNKIYLEDIMEFLEFSKRHRKSKHSFVIVCNQLNSDEVPEELMMVPTLQEAHDIVEMEEMERDLGF
jgi:hypothetical protein